MNIPEGYVLVPADPIKAIDMGWAYLDAAREAEPNKSHSFSHAGYIAMIGAAPFVCESNVEEYDEAKERELFEVYASGHYRLQELPLCFDDGEYFDTDVQYSWESWQACAKSRARSAE